MLGLVSVMSSLLAARRVQRKRYAGPSRGAAAGERGPTGGAEAEGAGRAQAAASDAARRRRLFVSRPGLVLGGRHQQADVGVQLDQQAALQHPHHHLDQLGLVRGHGEAAKRGHRMIPSGLGKSRGSALVLMKNEDAGADVPSAFIIYRWSSSSSVETKWAADASALTMRHF